MGWFAMRGTLMGASAAQWRGSQPPGKRLVWFEHSARMMMVEEPGRTLAALIDAALPLTRRAR